MKRSGTSAAFATLAAAGTLGGCGLHNPYAAEPRLPGAASTPASGRSEAARVGERYAVAARSFTADTLAAHYRRQLALSGGLLHRDLAAAGPPTPAEIAATRAQHARRSASVLHAQVAGAARGRATVTVTLEERAVATGSLTDETARYRAALRRTDGHWHVTAFTAVPDS